jgi:RNA polymerase sigma factor (sigma-70 family)
MPPKQFNLVLRYLRRMAGGSGAGDVTDADLLARFVTTRDEAAFELLLWRHGAMVLRVCRDVTRDEHAAEDAFQATFLVLVRKAASVRAPESLGAWLYKTAYRAALRARGQRLRTAARIDYGHDVAELPARSEPDDDSSRREIRSLVHEEVLRLPSKYSRPVILCYFEELTHEEAARKLGWPKGTVAGRLARARELLHKRLSRRGVALSAALAAVTATSLEASAVIPSALVQMTFRNGLRVAAGEAAVRIASPHVAALTQGVLQEMFWNKMKLIAALILSMGLVGGGVGLLAGNRPTGRSETTVKSAAETQDKKDEDAEALKQRRLQTVQNLMRIALAMHEFHDAKLCFPPAAIYDKNGKPLLSWRVTLLPQLHETDLYKLFHLDEPWDSPHNKTLLANMPNVYRIPGIGDATSTFYQVVVGKSTVFEKRRATDPQGPARGIRIADITDGTSNTLLVVEAGVPVPWTKPEELPYSETGKLPALGGAFKDTIHAAMADGAVRELPRNAPEDFLRALITRDGGEHINEAVMVLVDAVHDADPDQLKKQNDELRRQIENAQLEIVRLQQQLLARWKGKSEKTQQESLREQLKLEAVQLERRLQDLKSMAWGLRSRLDKAKGVPADSP